MSRQRFRRLFTRSSLWGGIASGVALIWRGFDNWGNAEFLVQKWTQLIWPAISAVAAFILAHDTWFQAGLFLAGLGWLAFVVSRPESQTQSPKDTAIENERQKIRERIEKEELEKFQEELRKKAAENRAALAKPIVFDFGGFCWEIRPRFFEAYRTVDNPSEQTLDDAIRGPFCPKCSRSLTIAEPGGWMADHEVFYKIEDPCHRCKRTGPQEILRQFTYFKIKSETYKEAQRLATRGEAFPSGKCAPQK